VVTQKHPRPWRVVDPHNLGDDGGILQIEDAAGEIVIGSTEWLIADAETLRFIVALVNAQGE
jgi:hypothetical protein